MPAAASRACAGPPSDAIARARIRSPTYSLGQLAERLDEALGEQQDSRAGADPVAERADDRGQRGRRDGEADEVDAGELDVGGALDGRAPPGSATPGQVVVRSRAWRRSRRPSPRERVPSWTSSPPRASSTATAVPQLPAPITAALRSGGRPPSHSHWSSMFGQIRSVTVAASAGDGCSVRGKVIGAPDAELDLARADPPAAAHVLGAVHGDRERPRRRSRAPGGRRRASGVPSEPERIRVPSGKMQTVPPRSSDQPGGLHRGLVGLPAADREGAEPGEDPALPAAARRARPWRRTGSAAATGSGRADHERVEEAAVVGGDDQPALDPAACSRPVRERRNQIRNAGCEDHACEEVERAVDAAARARSRGSAGSAPR